MADATAKRARLAERVRRRELSVALGVFEMISAKLADRFAPPALYMTGYGTVASALGLPDAGIASYTEMVSRAKLICDATETPLIADADTGYEEAGVAAIQLEDQEFPKKCGHTPGRRVIPFADAVRKIEVAVDARSDPNFLIVARTDSRTSLGLDEALRRAKGFQKAGADVIFVEAPESEAEFERIGHEIDAPLLANMVESGRSPVLAAETLSRIGFAIAIYPATGFCAAAKALEASYAHIFETGSSLGLKTPLYSIEDMHRLMGFEEVWAFEKKWAED